MLTSENQGFGNGISFATPTLLGISSNQAVQVFRWLSANETGVWDLVNSWELEESSGGPLSGCEDGSFVLGSPHKLVDEGAASLLECLPCTTAPATPPPSNSWIWALVGIGAALCLLGGIVGGIWALVRWRRQRDMERSVVMADSWTDEGEVHSDSAGWHESL